MGHGGRRQTLYAFVRALKGRKAAMLIAAATRHAWCLVGNPLNSQLKGKARYRAEAL